MLKNIKGAIFDMDGTLVDSLMLWDVLWEKFGVKFLNHEGFRPFEEDDKIVRTKTLKDAMEHIHSKYNIGNSGEELLATANELMINFYSNDVELKKGVSEFLEYCYFVDMHCREYRRKMFSSDTHFSTIQMFLLCHFYSQRL